MSGNSIPGHKSMSLDHLFFGWLSGSLSSPTTFNLSRESYVLVLVSHVVPTKYCHVAIDLRFVTQFWHQSWRKTIKTKITLYVLTQCIWIISRYKSFTFSGGFEMYTDITFHFHLPEVSLSLTLHHLILTVNISSRLFLVCRDADKTFRQACYTQAAICLLFIVFLFMTL